MGYGKRTDGGKKEDTLYEKAEGENGCKDTGSFTNGNLDFCGVKLTPKRKDFLTYYLTPGQPCFHNALQSALKAGYEKTTASVAIYGVMREPDIAKIISKNDELSRFALGEAAKRAIELKKLRADFDPLDYFERKNVVMEGKDGPYMKEIMGLKPLEEMTPEQRKCIDGIEVKGTASIPVYMMANREKNIDDIIKLSTELEKSSGATAEEETREIILERIMIREMKRAERPAGWEDEIVESPEAEGDYV